MGQRLDTLELDRLRLASGEGRRLALEVSVDPYSYGGQEYVAGNGGGPGRLPVVLDVSRMTGGGYSMRLRFSAQLSGPCQRCLSSADPSFEIDAREVDRPGAGEELSSPYVDREILDLRAWARDALALSLPSKIVCRGDCAGLCPSCGTDLNTAGSEHHHERAPDPRWAVLRELHLD